MPYKSKETLAAKRRYARTQSHLRASYAKQDAYKSDKKLGWTNDLTIEFVKELFTHNCFYCGSFEKMSLDRIDNSKPHNQDNVVGSCVNCNLTRGSMPYIAWLVVAKGMREAREKGLLNGWLRRA